MGDVVIYHAECPDGIAAAWAFKKLQKPKTMFHAAKERTFRSDKHMPDINDKCVFIVDFSYSAEDLLYIRSKARQVTVLDHHKSAALDLKDGVEGVDLVFDMSRCGAEIAWDWCHNTSRPWWLVHIRDRDLWEWKDPDSHAFSAALFERGLSFETFDFIDSMNEQERQDFIRFGVHLHMQQQKEVVKLCRHANLVPFQGYNVYALNTLEYRSECGSCLVERHECDFAVLYLYDLPKNCWVVSLRAKQNSKIDLSVIAKKFGGGGHPTAASFLFQGNIADLFQRM
jgi:oligoribonuclease NrnB/cAMP/cGMP phosphodiesterase (DHH superfamily)